MSDFDSAWAKWARGCLHAQELLTGISRYRAAGPGAPFHELRTSYDQRRRKVFFLAQEPLEPLLEWRVVLGDVAGNFRSALDHAAWALVGRGAAATTLTRRQAKSVYFPISGDRATFVAEVPRKLPGVRRPDLALVRAVQPYRRGKTRVPWHCLKLLDEMVNADKHRSITSLGIIAEITQCKAAIPVDCTLIGNAKGNRVPLSESGVVGFVPVKRTGPSPDVRLEGLEFTWYVTAHPRLPIDQWVHLTTTTIAQLLFKFSDPPSGLAALGVDDSFLANAHEHWDRMRLHWSGARGIPTLAHLPV